jgi:integrase/recombinase XerD
MSYNAAHHRWESYCRAAGIGIDIDNWATPTLPSFNSGVSIETVRRRIGHASTDTTQLHAGRQR